MGYLLVRKVSGRIVTNAATTLPVWASYGIVAGVVRDLQSIELECSSHGLQVVGIAGERSA